MKYSMIALWGLALGLARPALAYKNVTHDRITRHALAHLRDHPHAFAETSYWISVQEGELMEDLLAHAVVDTDYMTDTWLDSILHAPFLGASKDDGVNMFTTLSHFLNVTAPGTYWENDGFAYGTSSRDGYDGLLGIPSLVLKTQMSPPYGGVLPGPAHGPQLGPFQLGLKGGAQQWQKLYPPNTKLSKVVFPPANVPAELAMNSLLGSPRAHETKMAEWVETLPLVSGLLSTKNFKRRYWRAEVAGLPKNFDQLGIAMHMLQDMTVPHHALGTTHLCHDEFEIIVAEHTCPGANPDYGRFHSGNYQRDLDPGCRGLYDPAMVSAFLKGMAALDPSVSMALPERMRSLAKQSARWQWRLLKGDREVSLRFPDGRVAGARTCMEVGKVAGFHHQAKVHYNMAVAASVMVYELAAHAYERPSVLLP